MSLLHKLRRCIKWGVGEIDLSKASELARESLLHLKNLNCLKSFSPMVYLCHVLINTRFKTMILVSVNSKLSCRICSPALSAVLWICRIILTHYLFAGESQYGKYKVSTWSGYGAAVGQHCPVMSQKGDLTILRIQKELWLFTYSCIPSNLISHLVGKYQFHQHKGATDR